MKRAFSGKNLWENAPPRVRVALGRLLNRIPPRYLLGVRFRANLRFVEQAQWWSAERGREYQLEQVRSICMLAYERSPYYRATFDTIGFHPGDLKCIEDMAELPTIDKGTVRDNLDQMMTVPLNSRHIDYVATGGSTGTTLRFYVGRDRSAIEYAYLVSSWQRTGYRLGMPMAVIRGRVLQGGKRYEYDPLLRHHYYSNFDMTEDNMRWYIDHISGIGPCFLHVYPSSAATLAAFCRRDGRSMPDNVLGVLAESEMVYPEQRQMIEDVTCTRLFSSYGHCEKLVLAAGCEHTQLYHVWPTYGHFELLDERGDPVDTVGQSGEIVGTGFINRVVPFVRYRTGDYATYAGDCCDTCGRKHVVLSKIEGRWPRGALVTVDGCVISATALNLHDDTFERVRQYQFYQERPGVAELRVVPTDALSPDNLESIRRGLEPRLRGRIRLSMKVVAQVKLTPSGKFNLVDQHIRSVDPAVVRSSGR